MIFMSWSRWKPLRIDAELTRGALSPFKILDGKMDRWPSSPTKGAAPHFKR